MRITPPLCKFQSIVLISYFLKEAYSRFYKNDNWNKVNNKPSRAFVFEQKQVSRNKSEILETANERFHEVVNPLESSNSLSTEKTMEQNHDQASLGRRRQHQRESSRTMYMLDVW